MKAGRWLLMAILASLTAMLMVSSAFGRGQSAVIFDYEVTNDGGILFADEYERLGGVDTLGHPASYRFTAGRWIHLPGDAESSAPVEARGKCGLYLGNIFQMLEQAGLDDWLLREKGIPSADQGRWSRRGLEQGQGGPALLVDQRADQSEVSRQSESKTRFRTGP